jgi:hypothetical protein
VRGIKVDAHNLFFSGTRPSSMETAMEKRPNVMSSGIFNALELSFTTQ